MEKKNYYPLNTSEVCKRKGETEIKIHYRCPKNERDSPAQAGNFRRKVRISAIDDAEMKGIPARGWKPLANLEADVFPQLTDRSAQEGRNTDESFDHISVVETHVSKNAPPP